MKKIVLAGSMLVTLMCTAPQSAYADRKLSPEEVKSLISGKTFDGVNEKSGQTYVAHPTPDGVHNVHYPNGRKVSGKWHVTEAGQHCIEIPNFSSCADVYDRGNGVYQRVDNGVVTHTLKNFREGDYR